jgi:threonine dehydrogenase-like Zn-dependent dehydrogenase
VIAAMAYGPGEVGPGDAVVRVVSVGLCGSDLHLMQGHRWDVPFPLVPGHEIGGRVEALPAGYAGPLVVGDVVAVEPYLPCHSCRTCRSGAWPHCPGFTAHGVHRQGGLAQRLVVHPDLLHATGPLAPSLSALVEPLAIGVMAVSHAVIEPGDQVLVTGAGPIGLMVLLAALDKGARVLVADRLPARLALARDLGAEVTVDVTDTNVLDVCREWTSGDGVAVAVEATGVGTVGAQAVAAVRLAGQVVVVGLSDDDIAVPVRALMQRGVRLVGSRAGLFPEAVDLIRRRPDEVGSLVSHRFPLNEAGAAFAQALDHPETTMKVLVDVS